MTSNIIKSNYADSQPLLFVPEAPFIICLAYDVSQQWRHEWGWNNNNHDKEKLNEEDNDDNDEENSCEMKILKDGDTRHFNPLIQEDSKAYKSLEMHNHYDIILYEYALQLYEIQSKTLFKDLYSS